MYSQSHPKSKPWCTKPFSLYNEMAHLVDGSRASGKRKYRPKKRQELEETPRPSILIDPILLAEERRYLDTDLDSDVHLMSLALSHYLYIFRVIPPRTDMKTGLIQITSPKEEIRALYAYIYNLYRITTDLSALGCGDHWHQAPLQALQEHRSLQERATQTVGNSN